jgi:hypothetical protein
MTKWRDTIACRPIQSNRNRVHMHRCTCTDSTYNVDAELSDHLRRDPVFDLKESGKRENRRLLLNTITVTVFNTHCRSKLDHPRSPLQFPPPPPRALGAATVFENPKFLYHRNIICE